jgi:hypothetical protein
MGAKPRSTDSPAVERVRKARELLAKDYNYDIDKYCRALMAMQAKSKRKYWTPKKRGTRA